MPKGPNGLYRNGRWVQVLYGRSSLPMTKYEYVKKGYKPDFALLPTKEEYERAYNAPRS